MSSLEKLKYKTKASQYLSTGEKNHVFHCRLCLLRLQEELMNTKLKGITKQ